MRPRKRPTSLAVVLGLGLPIAAHAQAGHPPLVHEAFSISAEYGQCIRTPRVEYTSGRIGTDMINDGYMGFVATYRFGQQEIGIGWLRHQNSVGYTISDPPYGRSSFKNTSDLLAYTRVPARLGLHLLPTHRHLRVMPYLSMAWITVDQPRPYDGNGSGGTMIDATTGDTVVTASRYTVTVLQKNAALFGLGAAMAGQWKRWSLQLNAEWLTGKEDWSVLDVVYERTSSLQGSVSDNARIRSKTANFAVGLALQFRLNGRSGAGAS